MLTFQDLTQKLIQFWAKKGCIIHQGHDVEVGAGTFNPATFLRCLGPEPYKTVYVEPSRRPQDGRYGENPNRLQLFHQLQVIMKPSPPDIKQYYLESLQEIGFNLNEHDIRFVHDDWESPTLGASGLGWEVWIDGMEVTQFTYFQSVAGFDLHPISVEITYGLERICMLSQRVSNFFVMKYNDELTYGDVYHRNEVEWSHYNFKESTPEMWFKHFEDFEKEAKNLISLNLPIPAYDFVMKASHAFNMLEARGVISVTERTGYIQRIRELAKLSATEYLLSREKLNFPLLKDQSLSPQPHPASFPHTSFHKDKKRDFLFEIGTEQLPATFVPIGMRELEEKIRTFLTLHKIPFSALRTYGSPQRIAIQIDDLAEGTSPSKVEKRGPQTSVAFDNSGNLTAQGKGFFDANQIPYANLETLSSEKGSMQIRTLSGKEYLFAEISEEGKSTLALLQPFLSDIFSQLSFPKVMRWGNFSLSFARPIRWITAVFGSEVIPITVTGIKSSNITWGHAQRHHEPILLSSAKDYEKELEKAFVIADAHKRREKIISQLRAIEEKTNCKALSFERVLNEVTFLVEWPELAVYNFDPKFLKAPAEVLVSEMVEHQRYFPLEEKKTGKLAPHFVITADQKINPEILQNNLAVLSARLTDGVFLYTQDLKIPLETFVEKLKTVTFHKELGSVYDKLSRIEANALLLNEMLHVSTTEDLKRASHLCKADLASDMVHEFPELQGIIGMYYAKHQGESELIATAMKEHWQPISEKGALPETDLGRILSLADKLDNILSYYSVGIKPTSSKDPYALRRQTLGILKILVDAKWSLSLDQIFSKKLKNRPLEQEVIAFFSARLKTLLEEMGFEKDEIEACLSEQVGFNPLEIVAKVKALHHFRKGSKDFGSLVEVFRRAKGQIGGRDRHSLEINLFTTDQEKDLYACLTRLDPKIQKHLSLHEYEPLFSLLTELQKPMAHLFDQVKILDPDEKIKANRIALLQEVFERFQGVIDMDKLQIKA